MTTRFFLSAIGWAAIVALVILGAHVASMPAGAAGGKTYKVVLVPLSNVTKAEKVLNGLAAEGWVLFQLETPANTSDSVGVFVK